MAEVVARSPFGLLLSATMTESVTKIEARRRAREATRRANEERAARDRANVDDAADFLVAIGKVDEVEIWRKERLAQLRAQIDAEAAKRLAAQRSQAGAAVARMQSRGETPTTIAARTDIEIRIVRAMARHAPTSEKSTAENTPQAMGLDIESDPTPEGSAPPPANLGRM